MGLMGLMGSVNPSTPSTPFGPINLNGSVQLGLTCTFKSMGFGPVQLDLLTVWLDLGLKSDQAGPLTTLTQTLICSIFILGIRDGAIIKAHVENWKYFIKTGR